MSTATTRGVDDYDGLYGIERSFRLIFEGGEEIVFFADTDAEKTKWCVPSLFYESLELSSVFPFI
jgi:hypothetical protein